MELVLAGINKVYLESISLQSIEECSEVIAVVPYCDSSQLFQIAHSAKKKLTFYGRLDETVPVPSRILKWFTNINSMNYLCYLYRGGLHAKIIWFKGVGVYIGSANLTNNGWFRNIEAGLFLEEKAAIDEGILSDLEILIDAVEEGRITVDDEMVARIEALESRRQVVRKEEESIQNWFEDAFGNFPKQPQLTDYKPKFKDKKANFLKEWHFTLGILRNIQKRLEQYKPDWIDGSISNGVHVDQFLHALHYRRVRKGNSEEWFDRNKLDSESALKQELLWWNAGDYDYSNEKISIEVWAPKVAELLHKDKIRSLTEEEFIELCSMIHATREYSLRGANAALGLTHEKHKHDFKIEALGRLLFNSKSKGGNTTLNTIYYVLYGGSVDDVPVRLFNATHDIKWKIKNLGIRSLGEMVGWAMPDKYPPRNGRTIKALRALGYDVGRNSKEDELQPSEILGG